MHRLLILVFITSTHLLFAQKKELDSLKEVSQHQEGRDLVLTLNELSWYIKNINPDSAILLADQSLVIAKGLNDESLIAASYNSLGNAYQTIGLYDTAIIYLTNALTYRKLEKDSVNIAKTLNNLGICSDEKGAYEKALFYYFEGLKIAEDINDLSTSAMLIGNIGIVYKKQEDYIKVLEYYERALGLYNILENQFGVAVTTGNIGSVYLQLKDFEKAITYSRDAENLYGELGYTRYIPYSQGNAALAYDSLGDARAEELYLEAIEGHLKHNNQYELAYSYKNIGSYYLEEGQDERANEYLLRAVTVAKEIDAKEMYKDALNMLAESYAQSGKYTEAYTAVRQYEVLKDELYQLDKTKQIYELQTEYETEKKEQQIALQNAELAKQKAELWMDRFLIAGLFVVIFSLVIIGVLIRKRMLLKREKLIEEEKSKTKEAQIKAAISSQETERSRFARDLHDGFGQMISILNLNLKSLQQNTPNRQEIFDKSAAILEEMYQELKGICFNLMPQTLIKHGVKSAIQEFAARINISNKVFIETSFFGMEERMSDLQEISLYRICQEWVNNILKYSDADKITIQLICDEEGLTLMIEDNGQGFDPDLLVSSSGNGWKNMNSRCNLIKGELELDTTVGIKGSTLVLNAPAVLSHKEAGIQIPA